MRLALTFLLFFMVACENKISPSVSLMYLVVNGNRYDGSEVIVTGYYQSGLEESALYFSKDQADYGMVKDAIWINLDEDVYWQNFPEDGLGDKARLQSLSGKYITVEGVYTMRDRDDVGAFGGAMVATRVIVRRKR